MNRRLEQIWTRWSTTKLDTLHQCPLAFKLGFVIRQIVPQSADKVFGAVIHYFLKRHLALKNGFRSPETFANSFIRYWLDVVNGLHGPDYQKSPPIQIRWGKRSLDDYIGLGVTLLRGFYTANLPYFDGTLPCPTLLEKKIVLPWQGVQVVAKIDRIETTAQGDVLYDYKTGLQKPSSIELAHGHQFTFYSLAYWQKYGRPPAQLAYWFLSPDITEIIVAPNRTFQNYQELTQELLEARDFVHEAILPSQSTCLFAHPTLGKYCLPEKRPPTFFRHKGKLCDTCDFRDVCLDYNTVETFSSEDIISALQGFKPPDNSVQLALPDLVVKNTRRRKTAPILKR